RKPLRMCYTTTGMIRGSLPEARERTGPALTTDSSSSAQIAATARPAPREQVVRVPIASRPRRESVAERAAAEAGMAEREAGVRAVNLAKRLRSFARRRPDGLGDSTYTTTPPTRR